MGTIDLDLVPALRTATEDGSLVLMLQPEVDLASGAIVGMEGLLRWRHDGRGVLYPADFLPTAEATGLLPALGWWAIEDAIKEAASWRRLPPTESPRVLWVNVAGMQLAEDDFVGRVVGLLERYDVHDGTLGLEVTEQTLADDGKRIVGVLEDLHAAGIALAVDDFGTWYSSLATLGELPIDAVKLDQSFVRGVGTDLEDDSIVASVIRLAHAHDLYVVAEGVESWAESARLCELGCDRAFGYLFSAPETPERARWLLMRGWGWRHEPGREGVHLVDPSGSTPTAPLGG